MKISKIFIYSFFITLGIFPSLMNSADIYEHARGNGKIISSINSNIIPENLNLNSSIFIIQTKEEYADPQIHSKCQNTQKLLTKEVNQDKFIYLIYLRLTSKCGNDIVYLKNGDEIYTNTAFKINIQSYEKLFEEFSNYSDSGINKELALIDIANLKLENSISELTQKKDIKSKLELMIDIYSQKDNEYMNIFLSNLLSSRKNLKYISPVVGKTIPTRKNIIPNASRPYRAKYTDGIHHGWDIFVKEGTPVRSLADGIIIKITNNFKWSDFDKILWKNLTSEDKAKNLDVYRGNQVWLKTADGNVTFYSHLENIPNSLQEGQFVKVGEYLGQVGRTGVPDKEYKDFHLHFEVQINPHTKIDSSFQDIMNWQYFGKGKNYETLIADQTRLFSN